LTKRHPRIYNATIHRALRAIRNRVSDPKRDMKDAIKHLLRKETPAPAATGTEAAAIDDTTVVETPTEDIPTDAPDTDPSDGDPADTDADPENDGDADDSPADESDDERQERKSRAQKRVLAEIAKRKAAESKLAEAEERLSQAQSQLASNAGNNRVFESQAEIDSRRAELRKQLRTVETAIRKGEYTAPNGEVLDVEELEAIRADLEDERDLSLPAAEKLILQRERIENELVSKHYPALLDANSPEAKEAARLFKVIPGLRGNPEAKLLIGDLLRGRKLRLAAKTAPAPSAQVQRRTPPAEPTGGRASPSGAARSGTGTNSEANLLALVSKRIQRRN
jgi:hypothetical protein